MTPSDFDRDAPPCWGTDAIPAVPDACGTTPLFGEKLRATDDNGPDSPDGGGGDQGTLF